VSLSEVRSGVFLGPRLFVLGEVLKCLLEGQNRFGDVVEAQAVGPVPPAGLVLVPDLDDDLGQRDHFAIIGDYVSKDCGSDSAYFERDFWFCHVPGVPYRLEDTNLYDRTTRWGYLYLSADAGKPPGRERSLVKGPFGERSGGQTFYEAAVMESASAAPGRRSGGASGAMRRDG
jgi:hypothetical protein